MHYRVVPVEFRYDKAVITIHDGNAVTEYVHITVSLTVEAIPLSTACGDVPVYTENLVSPAIMLLLDTSGSMAWDTFLSINPRPCSAR